jgi:hypothetical protein
MVEPVEQLHVVAQHVGALLGQDDQVVHLGRVAQQLDGAHQHAVEQRLDLQRVAVDAHAPVDHEGAVRHQQRREDLEALAQGQLQHPAQGALHLGSEARARSPVARQ